MQHTVTTQMINASTNFYEKFGRSSKIVQELFFSRRNELTT